MVRNFVSKRLCLFTSLRYVDFFLVRNCIDLRREVLDAAIFKLADLFVCLLLYIVGFIFGEKKFYLLNMRFE